MVPPPLARLAQGVRAPSPQVWPCVIGYLFEGMRFPCAYCMLICQSLLLFEFVEQAFQGVMRDFSVPHLRVLKKALKFILEFATYPCLPIQLQVCE